LGRARENGKPKKHQQQHQSFGSDGQNQSSKQSQAKQTAVPASIGLEEVGEKGWRQSLKQSETKAKPTPIQANISTSSSTIRWSHSSQIQSKVKQPSVKAKQQQQQPCCPSVWKGERK
jgi:hypothetical protein